MRAVRSQQHGRAVCGQGALGEKKVFFGDFLSPDKKLPAPWSGSSCSKNKTTTHHQVTPCTFNVVPLTATTSIRAPAGNSGPSTNHTESPTRALPCPLTIALSST